MFDAFPLSRRYFVFSWVFVFVRFIVFTADLYSAIVGVLPRIADRTTTGVDASNDSPFLSWESSTTRPWNRRVEVARTHRASCTCRPTFGAVMWVIFTTLTSLWIIDRFTTQISPRQGFSIGAGKAAGDRTEIIPGPWTVAFYDVFARFSGRPPAPPLDSARPTKARCCASCAATAAWS